MTLGLTALLLVGCSDSDAPARTEPAPERWSDQHELLFQKQEALRHSLEQLKQQQTEAEALEALKQNPANDAPADPPTTDSAKPTQ